MTIAQCYQQLGGDYSQALSRLSSPALVERFVGMFLKDSSFDELCAAVRAGQTEAAFRAAHTLKGVSANLSFDRLHHSSSDLVELLRGRQGSLPPETAAIMERVTEDYRATVAAIRAFQS